MKTDAQYHAAALREWRQRASSFRLRDVPCDALPLDDQLEIVAAAHTSRADDARNERAALTGQMLLPVDHA